MPRGAVQRVRRAVARALAEAALPSEARIVVGVSGGQDSVCLLDALAALLPRAADRLSVIHVDHTLREESSDDAAAVVGQAARLGLRCSVLRADVRAYAQLHHLGVEEAGRFLRYQALGASAVGEPVALAATAHTVDDLAETVLLHILRGAGPSGLTGMRMLQRFPLRLFGPPYPELNRSGEAASPFLKVIRPLLGVERGDTELYCRERGLVFRTDPMNFDASFGRNRVRHHLVPLLRTYNPSIVPALTRLARLSADDDAELESRAEGLLEATMTKAQGLGAFTWDAWAQMSSAIQRRVLRGAFERASEGRLPTFQALEDARLWLEGRSAGRYLDLGSDVGLETTREGFNFVLRRPAARAKPWAAAEQRTSSAPTGREAVAEA